MRWSLLIGLLLIGVVYSQVDPGRRRLCNAQISCRDCILANPDCVWCAIPSFNGSRCYVRGDTMVEDLCPEDLRQAPIGDTGDIENVPLVGLNQVSPRRISVDVRPGQPQTFQLTVRPARNFPIDLYLLMDLSFSMRDDLQNLQSLSSNLANSIVALSTNFSIGFGSFVEKVAAPFVSLDERFQTNPCRGTTFQNNCDAVYSYRHVISLTSNSTDFRASVQQQRISGNQDLPEGGLDGFLQALLCTKIIGWRDLSRKLLLYITDAGFHFAGDGKLAGIVLPHPNECLLKQPSSGREVNYQDALKYDYPSVGQIAQALRTQDIIPIFAAQQGVREFYDEFALELGDGAFVGTLESDSSNVVRLVENLYNTISQRVLFDQEPIPGVSVQVTPIRCPGGFIESGVCSGLPIEREATFDVSVSITECTPELINGQTVPLRVVGFGNVDISVRALCQCRCETDVIVNDPLCSGNGNLTCGQCSCNPGTFGELCQCDVQGQAPMVECPIGDNNEQCTGRGACQCGVCSCLEGFFGAACECAEEDCINPETGLLCSDRGLCGCDGRCICNIEPVSQLQFSGDLGYCECTPNTQNCRDPNNQTSICNGRGVCGCEGTCECMDPFLGQFCEDCSGSEICFDSYCNANRECADCALDFIVTVVDDLTVEEFFDTATLNSRFPEGASVRRNSLTNVTEVRPSGDFCRQECGSGIVIISGADTAEYDIDAEMAVRCEVIRDSCTYQYFVGIDEFTNNFTAVHVDYTRSCPEAARSTQPWVIAISIIIPLLILGILLLALLKALLLLWDYIEVKKFEKDLKNTKYSKNENPLYRSAAKDYKNPIYGQ